MLYVHKHVCFLSLKKQNFSQSSKEIVLLKKEPKISSNFSQGLKGTLVPFISFKKMNIIDIK
jgi:hypothetical protein